MKTSLRDTWSELSGEAGPTPFSIHLRLVFGSSDARAYAAVTAGTGLPALLLELPDAVRPSSFRTLITPAFQMSAPSVEGLPKGRWAVLVELTDPAFSDLFEVMADDVLHAIQSAPRNQAPLLAAQRCIERWRRFVERKGAPLTDEEVQGLIGEIVVLCRCARRFGADTALTAWTGPDRSPRDFELPDSSVEVKTYHGDDSATVSISSPDQLDGVTQRPAYLAAVRLTPSDAQGLTLSGFIMRALDVLGTDVAAAGTFEERLATAGYLAVHAPLYTKRFTAGPVMTYEIIPGFPRIRSIDVPQGVLAVRFALSIPALAPFQTAANGVIGDCVLEIEAV